MPPSHANSVVYPLERQVFIKDYMERQYGIMPYYLTKFIVELTTKIVSTLIFSLVLYFALDLNTESAKEFFIFFGVLFLIHLCGGGYSNLAGVLSRNHLEATVWSPTIAAPLTMFGGYFSSQQSLSASFYWIKYVSGYYFGFLGLILNEFTNEDIGIDNQESPLKT